MILPHKVWQTLLVKLLAQIASPNGSPDRTALFKMIWKQLYLEVALPRHLGEASR